MKSFWGSVIGIVIAVILGTIVAIINGGDKMDGIYLSMLYLIWFELRG